ncbi:hypothetical protein AVEN_77288-1 [Araneus ventricosus]|uniref:Uncharacterized protein n=1 Tax=Araneus ventricosus TaxID=182803 RepID=A0A4Y2QDB1_ARAVE|nr:hypothetical protein AVEN_77288-1 [Araneus ventricosus]
MSLQVQICDISGHCSRPKQQAQSPKVNISVQPQNGNTNFIRLCTINRAEDMKFEFCIKAFNSLLAQSEGQDLRSLRIWSIVDRKSNVRIFQIISTCEC